MFYYAAFLAALIVTTAAVCMNAGIVTVLYVVFALLGGALFFGSVFAWSKLGSASMDDLIAIASQQKQFDPLAVGSAMIGFLAVVVIGDILKMLTFYIIVEDSDDIPFGATLGVLAALSLAGLLPYYLLYTLGDGLYEAAMKKFPQMQGMGTEHGDTQLSMPVSLHTHLVKQNE